MTSTIQVPAISLEEFAPEPISHTQSHRGEIIAIGTVAGAVLASWLRLSHLIAPFEVISLLATVFGGLPIFQEAWEAVRERRMTMELSMTIALVAATLIGEFFTAAVIVLFVLTAELNRGFDGLARQPSDQRFAEFSASNGVYSAREQYRKSLPYCCETRRYCSR
jgi:cation transport ATPase